jgi:hypothetical protein
MLSPNLCAAITRSLLLSFIVAITMQMMINDTMMSNTDSVKQSQARAIRNNPVTQFAKARLA